jgi:hypothetical protein
MKNKIEETKALLEKVSGRKVSLVEKFAEPAKIDKDKKGMFKGDNESELKSELSTLKKKKDHSEADTKRIREIEFAIRAKSGWGKVESVVKEAKDDKKVEKKEKESPKEKKVDKATDVAANVAPASVEKTVAGIIPPVAIAQIQSFMDETLADINEGLMELQTMKIDANTIASGDDYYEKAEELQDEIKQIARMATFVKNTIIAKKFDATLLDKIISYKNSTPAPAMPEAPIAGSVEPIM